MPDNKMEFKVVGVAAIPDATPEDLRNIRSRVRNLLLDYADESDIDVTIDFATTEVWSGFGSGFQRRR